MSILEKQYEANHIELMRKGYDDLARMMKVTADQLAIKIHSLQAKRELHPSKYGSQLKRNERLLKQIELAFKSLENDLLSGLEAQTTEQWKLANTKNFILTKQYLGAVKKKYNKPNYEALAAFQKRNINGMNLSDRIHNLTETTKQIYMDYIGSGITQGKSAISIARDLNAINSDPKNVTVYDKKGNPVKLGKISTLLQPDAKGRGIFKKPLNNLFRLTRTETNAAYRLADHERMQQLDFVVGFEVHLSKSHKLVDMCDFLAGVYPKTFVFSGWHPSCYSDDTEIMTKSGWKLFSELTASDRIFSLNPDTKIPEYVGITRQYKREYNDDMVHFNNAFLSILVTKDHDMVYQNKSDGRFVKKKAIDYSQYNGGIYRSSEYKGNRIESIRIGKYDIDFDLFAEFMGYYLSDGSITKDRPFRCTISQRDDHDVETYEKIHKCLLKMPFNFSVKKEGFHFHDESFYRYLDQFGKAFDKFIPEEILNSSKYQIQIFLDAFISCDGRITKPKQFTGSRGTKFEGKTDSRIYYTSSPQMMSDLGECIVKIGKRPGFKNNNGKGKTTQFKNGEYTQNNDGWIISECVSVSSTQFKKDFVPYSGFVYDIELERNHIMYLRRNGKPYWGHNCLCYVTTILKTREEFNKDLPSSREVKQIPVSAQRYVKTEDMSRYDWHKANFNEKNEPTERVGGPSKNIEPYKISVKSRDYRPQENILVNAGKV